MADGISDAFDGTFPAADAIGELNPGENKHFKVDSLSTEITTSREIKERAEAQEKKEKKKNSMQNSMQTLKTAMLISAAVVAIAGVAFAITKKLKEK